MQPVSKKQAVPAREREDQDKTIEGLRQFAFAEKAKREALEHQLQNMNAIQQTTVQNQQDEQQRMLQQQQQMQERMQRQQMQMDEQMKNFNAQMEQQRAAFEKALSEKDAVHQQEIEKLADEDTEMQQVQAELETMEVQHKKEMAQKHSEIAALMARANVKKNPPVQTTESPFPSNPPQMVPQFTTQGVRQQRRLQVIENTTRMPIIAIRTPEGPGGSGTPGGPAVGDAADKPMEVDVDDPKFYDLIAKIVTDVVKQLGVASATVTENPTVCKRQPCARTRAIHAQQAEMTSDQDKMWKRAFRAVWRAQYSVTNAEDFVSYTPATEKKVERCNDGTEGPAEDDFDLDFGPAYRSSLWNVAVLTKMARTILEARDATEGKWGLPDVSEAYAVGELFMILKSAQEAWAKWKPRLDPTTMQYETEEEAAERAEAQLEKRRTDARENSHKTRKFLRRTQCVEMFLNIKTKKNAEDLAAWEFLKKLLDYLKKDGMSSEEDGVDEWNGQVEKVYRVKICDWRAEKVDDYLQMIDHFHNVMKTRGRRQLGAPKKGRIQAQEAGETAAVVGLPRTLYDAEWLAEEEKNRPWYVKETLCVSKSAFELLDFVLQDDKDVNYKKAKSSKS
ncbi:hypothetical protein C8R43DRAFT_1122091 [Mycena crocata]|nr:hypothetical protein C8R43DRAFT_1122091 [Mycena crocata]